MTRPRLRLFALLLTLLPVLAHAGEVYLAVAANFAVTAGRIGAEFQRQTGHDVHLSAGSSGKLCAQIANGAPYDVFLSADVERAQLLEREQLAVSGSRFTYGRGQLVLWSARLKKVDADVLRAARFTHLALANPKIAPYGAAALEVLNRLNVSPAVRARLVYGEDIGQTFQLAASGAADLAFVALSQLRTASGETAGAYWLVPLSLYRPIEQQAVLLRRADHNPAARAFLDYLQGPAARAIMARFGYITTEARP
ncbi:MAG TPA: molybdate ABC transporter substrate-binding protein [Candidatus Methylomirabilis sp.]|nr:molybdate ABC transporter substrate-binding protein [Candidatus Methylomirabilis sp.]